MADTRINALSTATVSLSDDFLPIDGTTAGTKKLSAYSPTFGGNATVGGTLTVGTESKAQYLTATSNIPSGFTANSSVIDFYLGEARFVAFGPDTSTKPAWKVQLLSSNGGISTDVLKSSAAGVISIPNTSASTSTSSGALVVGNGTSGGLGVGGAIYAGGDIITTKSNGVIKASGSSANAEVAAERLTLTPSSASLVAAVSQPQLAFTSDTAGSYTWGRILANSSEIVRVHSANLAAIANVAGAGIAVAGGIINTGSLTTGAPAGGTAAAWKLGAVASVSPTSPNRTIEVDIGGTIYYIHAKTTNN
jgi:hypothetical protein